MMERCQDCEETRDEEDMRECVACGCRVCAWCMDGPICEQCSSPENESPD